MDVHYPRIRFLFLRLFSFLNQAQKIQQAGFGGGRMILMAKRNLLPSIVSHQLQTGQSSFSQQQVRVTPQKSELCPRLPESLYLDKFFPAIDGKRRDVILLRTSPCIFRAKLSQDVSGCALLIDDQEKHVPVFPGIVAHVCGDPLSRYTCRNRFPQNPGDFQVRYTPPPP